MHHRFSAYIHSPVGPASMGARLHIYYPHVHVTFRKISMIKFLPHTWNSSRTCEFRGRASQFCSATMIFLSNFVPHVWFSWPHFWLQISTDILQYSFAYLLNTCICLSVPAFRWNCVESGRAGRDGISHSRVHIGSNKLCRACRDFLSSRILHWCARYVSVISADEI